MGLILPTSGQNVTPLKQKCFIGIIHVLLLFVCFGGMCCLSLEVCLYVSWLLLPYHSVHASAFRIKDEFLLLYNSKPMCLYKNRLQNHCIKWKSLWHKVALCLGIIGFLKGLHISTYINTKMCVCVCVCVFECLCFRVFLGHLESDWDTLSHKCAL